MEIENQYPIGKFQVSEFTEALKESALADIQFLPNALEAAITNLDEVQLHTPYRDGGWTLHQLVHHIADSHINAYIRFKLLITEENPTFVPYDENLWIQLEDVKCLPINISVTLLFALHKRWFEALKNLKEEDWTKTGYHTGMKKQISLWFLLQMYAWHGRHHVAQINGLRAKS